MREKHIMRAPVLKRYPQRVLDVSARRLKRLAGDRDVIKCDQARASAISFSMSCAASGMFVPGPKMAFTPASYRNW